MKYYRPLKPFKAISFDLDDTLYDNQPIIKKAEDEILAYLNQKHPELAGLTQAQCYPTKTLSPKSSRN